MTPKQEFYGHGRPVPEYRRRRPATPEEQARRSRLAVTAAVMAGSAAVLASASYAAWVLPEETVVRAVYSLFKASAFLSLAGVVAWSGWSAAGRLAATLSDAYRRESRGPTATEELGLEAAGASDEAVAAALAAIRSHTGGAE